MKGCLRLTHGLHRGLQSCSIENGFCATQCLPLGASNPMEWVFWEWSVHESDFATKSVPLWLVVANERQVVEIEADKS